MIILNVVNNTLAFPKDAFDLGKKCEQMKQEASSLKTAAVAVGIFAVAVFLAFQGPLSFIFSAVILVGCYDLFSISKIQNGLGSFKLDDLANAALDPNVSKMGSQYLYQDTLLLKHIVGNKK